jgi:hypothetical protein
LTDIKRIVLDVLKPHNPSIVELSRRLAGLHGVTGVNCTVDEVDQETESLKITVEGTSVDYGKVEAMVRELGGVIHSVDSVSAGKKLVEPAKSAALDV